MTRQEIERALRRLGMLANRQNMHIRLFLVGGSALTLGFNLRESTRDIDGLILAPEDHDALKEMIAIVGQEMNLRANWLNDDVRIFVTKISEGPVLLDAPGITVQRAATEQLLAMKLAASRDMQDDRDAMALLEELILVQPRLSKTEAWQQIEPFVPFQPGLKLRARELLDHFWQQRERDDSNQDPDT